MLPPDRDRELLDRDRELRDAPQGVSIRSCLAQVFITAQLTEGMEREPPMRPPEPTARSRARELAQVRPAVAAVPAAWMQSMKARRHRIRG